MKYFFAVVLISTMIARADQRCVLVEYSTSASCTNCVAASKTLYDAVGKTTRTHVALIAYHSPFPTADPFYVENTSETVARDGAYGISNNPTLHIDGLPVDDQSSWESSLQYEIASTSSPLSITLDGSIDGANGMVNVHLSQPAPAGYKLYAVITESDLYYAGSNGETDHNDVFRTTVGGWAGVDLGSTSSIQLPFHLGIDSLRNPKFPEAWDPEQCHIIVWLQDPSKNGNKDNINVSQAAQIDVSALEQSSVHSTRLTKADLFSLSPNPAHDVLDVHITSETSDMQFTMFDLLGRTVISSTGALQHSVSLRGLASGVYRAVLSRHGIIISSQPLVRN